MLKAIKLKQAQSSYDKNDPKTIVIENHLDELIAQSITAPSAKKTISLKKSMAKHRQFIFPFLYDPLIPYDNNASERSIRNIKVKLKVSGQFKTGQEHYCILRSIIDTTIKNGQSVFAAEGGCIVTNRINRRLRRLSWTWRRSRQGMILFDLVNPV